MKKRLVTLTAFTCCMSLLTFVEAAETELTFENDVRPILKAQCFHCHGESGELEGGLDLRLVRLMREGGDSGPSIEPHDAEASLLWEQVSTDEMPKGPKKLTAEQKSTIERWIDQGASTLRPEPADVEAARFTPEELDHWAFKPVRSPPIPRLENVETQNPIDHFVAHRFQLDSLRFSPEADRATLIRRVSFDLTGLPPTIDELEQFENDRSANAYENMVDRYLASPDYGVRWSRHWLDVAGYAETNGGTGNDSDRPYAWRYRDYVVECFNHNLPIDQFLIEQLAGDELVALHPNLPETERRRLLTATGLLHMAPDGTQTSNQLEDRNLAVAETIKVVSSSVLGLTVGCAQCHDHKYDPIGIDDYYEFRAIFDPLFPLENWQPPNGRIVDFTSEQVKQEAARIEAEAAKLDAALNEKRRALAEEIQAAKLADVPEQDREATQIAVVTAPDEQTREQKRLLELYPMVKPVSFISGFLIEYDQPSYRKFEQEAQKIAALRATRPASTVIMAARERQDAVPVSHVFFRGDPESPREAVEPDELEALKQFSPQFFVPPNREDLHTSGRRLAYAQHLVDGQHPLTARVFVNRIWRHHMGAGIVATPNDFGLAGERPSHPHLLDWLAADFVRHGWDLKRLHRLILSSRTYRQRSTRTPELDAMDPENRLLARMSVRRLEAEAIRDALLSVSGQLSRSIGGESIPVTVDPEGKLVIGRPQLRDGLLTGVSQTAASARRSLFVQSKRNLALNALATFDQPEMTPNCGARMQTIVASQALWFMNDLTLLGHANDLANELLLRLPAEDRIERLFLLLFSKPPTQEEKILCDEFLEQQRIHFEAQSKSETEPNKKENQIESQSWSALCQTLLATNRFLYVD